jgi:hypothetical protein
MSIKKRVAIMMELQDPWQRHLEIFSGILNYAREQGDWECVIDEFVPLSLPDEPTGPLPYDGVIARATKTLAMKAARLHLPVVNTWFHSPAKELPLVHVDFGMCARLSFEHLAERGFRHLGYIVLHGMRDQALQVDRMGRLSRENGLSFFHLHLKRNYGRNPRDWTKMLEQLDQWLDRIRTPIGIVIAEGISGPGLHPALQQAKIERAAGRCDHHGIERGYHVREALA